MRKLLMLSVVAGAAVLGLGASAEAAPVASPIAKVLPLAAAPQQAQVETVQYHCGPRCRAERRRAYRRRHRY